MSDITQVAHVLRNYRTFRQKPGSQGGGANHAGLKHLKNADFDRVAERILQRSWHNRKVASSMFKMAESVEALLNLQLKWEERYALARLLISSLTYAGLYRLEQEPGGNEASPYFIVETGQSLSIDQASPRKTRTDHPFPRWTRNYDDEGNRLVKPSYPSPPELEYKPEFPRNHKQEFSPWLEAVHQLEWVPFRINEEFLDLVQKLDKDTATRVIQSIPPDYDKRRKALDRKYKTKGLQKVDKKYQTNKPLTEEENRKRKTWWREHYVLEEQKRAFESRRVKFEQDLRAAENLRGKRFFHRLKMCHRGRIYYPEFSYQGSDFARAVIEFADGLNLDEEGWTHLLIHTENVFGERDDVDARLEKGIEDAGDYVSIGLDPMGQFVDWSTADKPFCFLRSCLEITDGLAIEYQKPESKDAQKTYSNEETRLVEKIIERWRETGRGAIGDGELTFQTHLPVELDQSNSAFQHIALMMDDKDLQEKANMGTVWSDLYTEVAKSDRMNISGLTDGKEKRKIIKLVAVPWSYGAHNRTCANDLIGFREESPHKAAYLNTLTVREVNDLTGKIIEVLNDEFKTCVEYRKKVEACVKAVKSSGVSDVIRWFTPLSFQMIQRKHKVKKVQGTVWSGLRDVEPQVFQPLGIDWEKNKTSAPANLVHSMDAALIHAVLCRSRFVGRRDTDTGEVWVEFRGPEDRYIYPVITIHDAFACHAPFASHLKNKLVSGLAELYKHFDPIMAFESLTVGGNFDPRDREIDLTTGKNIFS